VQGRQAEKYADRDAQIYAERETANGADGGDRPPADAEGYPATIGYAGHPEPARAARCAKEQGLLTDDEFAEQRAKILAG
jgi:hypothetical protein